MQGGCLVSGDIKIFFHHVYEYQKGVRNMVMCTLCKDDEEFIRQRLQKVGIDFFIQPLNNNHFNLFFGKKECMEVVRRMVVKPLNLLTPEEDFILGVMLGYDICRQCERYCNRKSTFNVF